MRSAWRCLLPALALTLSLWAEEAPLERSVHLRDGSVLKVRLADADWTLSPSDGKAPRILRLSRIRRVVLTRSPQSDLLARVGALVAALGDDRWVTREDASAALSALGPAIRGELAAARAVALDPEIKARLDELLESIPDVPPAPGEGLADAVVLGQEALSGDLGAWTLPAEFRGRRLILDREQVLELSADPIEAGMEAQSLPARTERIAKDVPGAFPAGATVIDFETDAAGRPLKAGQDVSRTFLSKGVGISTSIEGSIVSVNDYRVDGRSGGFSCATHQPLWQGTLTLRFSVPGNPAVPAGVTHVGFWIAAVSPDGTMLEALDSRGRVIAQVKTVASGSDFLSLRSSVPIAEVRIVPDPKIDSNYTFDDLIFDAPRPLAGAGHPDLFTVVLASGERLLGRGLSLEAGTVTLKDPSFGPGDLEFSLKEVRLLAPPSEGWKAPAGEPKPKGCWLLLSDGSRLLARTQDALSCPRLPEGLEGESLAALWGEEIAYQAPSPESPPPAPGEALVLGEGPPRRVQGVRLGKSWIEGEGTPQPVPGYATSPPVWFGPAPAISVGVVRLITGEELSLCGKDAYVLESWTSEGLELTRRGHPVRIPASEILSISLPPPG